LDSFTTLYKTKINSIFNVVGLVDEKLTNKTKLRVNIGICEEEKLCNLKLALFINDSAAGE